MHRYDDSRVLPYTPRQLFDLVADIAKYPEFLPWCLAARVGARTKEPARVGTRTKEPARMGAHQAEDGREIVMADLVVGTRLLRETFTSRVTLSPAADPPTIEVDYVKGPMRHMENRWEFRREDAGTRLEFHVAFEFRSALLERLMGAFFDDASRRMVSAFEARAWALYGAAAEPPIIK